MAITAAELKERRAVRAAVTNPELEELVLGGPPGFFAGGWNPNTATSGTDTTPAEKKLFVTSVWIPSFKICKGIGYLVGSVGGTNKAVAGLFNSAGLVVAKTSETTEGTLVGTAAEIQEIAFTSEYAAAAPGLYYIGITMNGNTARLRSIPTNTAGSNIFTTEASLTTKNVLETITPPTTFTGNKGPVAWVY